MRSTAPEDRAASWRPLPRPSFGCRALVEPPRPGAFHRAADAHRWPEARLPRCWPLHGSEARAGLAASLVASIAPEVPLPMRWRLLLARSSRRVCCRARASAAAPWCRCRAQASRRVCCRVVAPSTAPALRLPCCWCSPRARGSAAGALVSSTGPRLGCCPGGRPLRPRFALRPGGQHRARGSRRACCRAAGSLHRPEVCAAPAVRRARVSAALPWCRCRVAGAPPGPRFAPCLLPRCCWLHRARASCRVAGAFHRALVPLPRPCAAAAAAAGSTAPELRLPCPDGAAAPWRHPPRR
jgi:hypothetical protein